jgi:hypothetical protein
MRHNDDPTHFLMARSMAPALVTTADIIEYDSDGKPIGTDGRASYIERYIHGEIYRVRPDVHAVVHSHSQAVIPFADTKIALLPMNHIAAFLGTGAPVFDIRSAGGDGTDLLIRNNTLGEALAQTLGPHTVPLMCGHGSVVVVPTLKHGCAHRSRSFVDGGQAGIPKPARDSGGDEDHRQTGRPALGVVEAARGTAAMSPRVSHVRRRQGSVSAV